jgi:2,4-dienoyl-CoA reductase-like NADH-dependent reductase (Old Yellow Enzyme family)
MREKALAETGTVPKIIVQLTHSGRFAKPNGSPEPLVAYRNPHWERGRENQPYKIVTDDYCAKVTYSYAKAAKLAAAVGFDGVDVKCCHGYLLNEFLSAYDRPGRYGGDFENRTRLFFECLEAAQQAIPESLLLTTRLNACDCFPYPYGYGVSPQDEIALKECKEILKNLQSRFNMELINITLGNPYLIPHINRPGHNLSEPGEIGMKRILSIMKELQEAFPSLALVASGLSYPGENAVDYANNLLEGKAAKLAGFGRMTFAYPEFYRDYLENGYLDRRRVCLSCGKCTELMRAGGQAGCPVRDKEVYMPLYKKYVLNGGK